MRLTPCIRTCFHLFSLPLLSHPRLSLSLPSISLSLLAHPKDNIRMESITPLSLLLPLLPTFLFFPLSIYLLSGDCKALHLSPLFQLRRCVMRHLSPLLMQFRPQCFPLFYRDAPAFICFHFTLSSSKATWAKMQKC